MRPYYEHDGVAIYCGKAEEICRRIPATFDTLFYDPPFSVTTVNFRERLASMPAPRFVVAMLNPEHGYVLLEYGVQIAAEVDRRLQPAPLLWYPHARPVERIRGILQQTSGRILDPYMGSGSTLIAARELGREAIGVELEMEYCQLAEARLHWS